MLDSGVAAWPGSSPRRWPWRWPWAHCGSSIAGNHIGFEVKNLEAFCRQLEAQGITFDRPYTEVAALNLAVAFITDPFGTYIELTEGLDAF